MKVFESRVESRVTELHILYIGPISQILNMLPVFIRSGQIKSRTKQDELFVND